MVPLKYLALAAAYLTLAASDLCSPSDPFTIQSQGDADSINTCSTFKGDIILAQQITNTITLNGVEQITGSLTADGAANMSSLAAPQLSSIGNTFDLNGLITLTTLSFDSLSSVGIIKWSALPNLQSLSFSQGVSKAGSVSITNTGLTSLDGIDLETVGDFDLTANKALTTVNVNSIKNCTGLLNFAANSPKLGVNFPNLVAGMNMTFRNASSVSVPSLVNLTGQLGFFGNYFTDFTAPNLTKTGDLVFDNNANLQNISLPQLTTVTGGFEISNNDKLNDIDGVPNLQNIDGALDFSGSFNNVTLPGLQQVKGGFNLQSTGNLQCSTFDALRNNNVIQGSYTCKQTANPTSINGNSGTSTGSGSASSSSKSSAAIHLPVVGLTAIVGGLLQALL